MKGETPRQVQSWLRRGGQFPDIPLSVVTGVPGRGMPEVARTGRLANQQALGRLSPRGRHILAQRSGHFPQLSEAELVASVILDVLADARRGQPGGI